MIYYVLSALFPLLMWLISDNQSKFHQLDEEKKQRLTNRLTIIAIIPIFLLFVLRYNYIGADTVGYVSFFKSEIRNYSFKELFDQDSMHLEIGYRIYVKIISLFTNNYTVYFLVNGLVIFGTLLHFAKKYTNNPFVFFFLFITLGTYQFVETGLRQSLAMMICLWSVDFVKNKKPIRFILLVILAYYFHKSALIFLIVYPLSKIKRYNWMITVYTIMTAFFIVDFSNYQELFNELLGYEYTVEETDNGGIFMLLILILFAFSFFMTYDQRNRKKTEKVIFHLSLLTVMFWILRLISRTAERISFYFIFGIYIFFSKAVDCHKDELADFLKYLLIFVCLALFIYRNMNVRYQFFWQGI